MRLHSLRLQAFGPFVAEQVIDFEPLGAGGLFLLDGPTGAGKSTVLDAITFALYGPGDGGGWGRLHSHFAPPGLEPSVRLEFSVRGVRQRVTRSPEFRRPKLRGDGTTLEKAQVHLQRFEGGRWVSRSSRKDEVGEMLCDDLGLTREQFTQVVLLPQGEFMRFLQASDDERRSLLTKLFGTGLYDRITEELDRRRVVASRELDTSRQALGVHLGAVMASAGLDGEARDELSAASPTDRDAVLRTLAASLTETTTAAELAVAVAEAELVTARSLADATGAAADQMRRLVQAREDHETHERTRGDYEQAAQVLGAATRAEALRPLLRQCDETQRAVGLADEAVARLGVTAPGDDLRAAAADRLREAAELRHLLAREGELTALADEVTRAEHDHEVASGDARRMARRDSELPVELATASALVRSALEQRAALPGLVARRDALATRLTARAELDALEPQRVAAQLSREASFATFEQAAAHHRALAEQRLANMAAELAGALTDGAPCTVCGALEHPEPAAALPGAVDAAAVRAAEELRAAAEHEYEQARSHSDRLDLRCAELAATASGTSPAQLRAEHETAVAAARSAERACTELPAAEAAVARLEHESLELADAQRVSAQALTTAAVRLETAHQVLTQARAELADAAGDHPSVTARHAALGAQARLLAEQADAQDRLRAAERDHESSCSRAAAEADLAGFSSLAAARSTLLDPHALEELQELARVWLDRSQRLRGVLESAQLPGLDAAGADAVLARAEQARNDLAAAQMAARAADVRATRARDMLDQFTVALRHLDAAQGEHDALAEAAQPVVHLAKLAKGVAGHRRVALTTYVLRQWFERVVAAANVRLSGMSSGRYELVRVDEGASKAERVGLTVSVLDRHTGEQRSARSLSGGETFYTSLSLALGLADVVRAEAGGVDLDTLFIDEGFGSLDAETLDQVMGVIDELRDRGRTVGIVSHVSEMKNRIAERIEVRRLPDGSSAVRLIA